MTHVPFSPEDEVPALHLSTRNDDNGFDDGPSDGLSAYENDDLDLDLDDDLEDEDDREGDDALSEDDDDAADDDDIDDLDDLDDADEDPDFPRGDGTAETGARVHCPYCGESVEIALDPGGGSVQRYVEDCEVCCRPWNVTVRYDEEGLADVNLDAMDE